MSFYTIVILTALLVYRSLTMTANLLNLHVLSADPPPEFRYVYSEYVYWKSQEHHRAKGRLKVAATVFNLILLICFWFLGGFNHLDQWLRGFNLNQFKTGILYIGMVLIVRYLLNIPFTAYLTFVIEKRFFGARTTPLTFAMDRIKSVILYIVLGGPMLAAILLCFEWAEELAWIYCWLISFGFLFFFKIMGPEWFMPLFNKFEPITERGLCEALTEYTRAIDFTIDNISIFDGSRRKINNKPFIIGFGQNKRISIPDTMIEKFSIPEMIAIVARFVYHEKKRIDIKSEILGFAHIGVLFFIMSICIKSKDFFAVFAVDETSVYIGLVLFGIIYSPIEGAMDLFLNFYLRKVQFACDRFAAHTAPDPMALVSALKKLAVENLENLKPHPLYDFLNNDIPPTLRRVAKIHKFLKTELGYGG